MTAATGQVQAGAPAPAPARPALVRPRVVLVSGVSVALARHLRMPVAAVRVFFVVLQLAATAIAVLAAVVSGRGIAVFAAGLAVLLYLWLWAFVPREPGRPGAGRTRRAPVAIALLVAAVVVGFAEVVVVRSSAHGVVAAVLTAVLGAAAYLWAFVVDPRDPAHAHRAARVRTVAAAAMLLVFGGLLLPRMIIDGNAVGAVWNALFALLCVAGFIVPPLVTRATSRAAERAIAAREEQRAEIAAHLHDSVLQTLAIIQNRAGAGSEVARIARAQERELRDWLFAGTDPFAGDVATELRTIARELELEHAVRIEVVTVGEVGGVESAALVGAAREAMVNAARHAGGEVTVYAEATSDRLEVFVRDRGAGFDPDAVPDGRLGIRESIVGRMARAGGTGEVVSGADGTEVVLRMPRAATIASVSEQGEQA